MSHKKSFAEELDKLFKRRTHWLRSCVGDKKPGPPPHLSKNVLVRSIEKLQDIASQTLANRLAKIEFEKYTGKHKSWQIKGHGLEDKRRRFEYWYEKYFSGNPRCIYIFWRKNKCIYIGRTGKGGSRPLAHFEKYWFFQSTRIAVYPVLSKSQTSKLECIAIHRFNPTKNKKKAATEKWSKHCPLCGVHRNIDHELHKIFKLN